MIRRAINRVGEEDFPLLFDIRYADTMAQSTYMRQEKLLLIEETRKVYQDIIDQKDCVSLKSLAVNGKDLISLGIKPSKQMGDILKAMLEDVLEDPSRNTKDFLLEPERLRNKYMKDQT